LGEIFENYLSLLKGQELKKKEAVKIAYRDFVKMEKEALASEEQQNYWK
jgi:hypothetical protein